MNEQAIPGPAPRQMALRYHAVAAAVATLLTLASHGATAQEAPDKTSASTEAAEGKAALATVTVIGTSLKTDVQLYPGSVSVVPQEALDRTGNPIEALASVPGVTTGGDSGRDTGQQFNIRGFGYQSEDRVIVLHDGVRRSAGMFSNHVSSFRADNDLIKHMEVVKGASSVQHGGGAIGGVVSMVTKSAHDFLPAGQALGGAAKLRYEDNNRREAYAAAAFAPHDKPFELLVYGKKGRVGALTMSRPFSTDAQGRPLDTVDNKEDMNVAFVEGVIKPSSEQRLALSLYDYRIDNKTTWQSLYHTNYSNTTGPVKGKLHQQDLVAKYRFTPVGNPWIDLSVSAYHANSSYDRGYAYVDKKGQSTQLAYDNQDKRDGLRASNESHFQTGSVAHRLVTGMDYERRAEDAIYMLNGARTDFGSMPNTYNDLGFYAHLESSMLDNRLKLQLGGRYDRFDRRVKANKGSYKGSNFSPRVGASFELFEGFNLLGNWSEAFRAPTPHETSPEGPLNPHYWYLPNPDLKAETIQETEVGASWTRRGLLTHHDALRSKLMYFNGRIKNMIRLAETRTGELSPQGSPYGVYQNVDRVNRHGVELQVDYQSAGTSLGVSFATLRQTNKATGQVTPQAFADKLALHGHFMPLHGLQLGANVTHWLKPRQNPETTRSGGQTYWYVRQNFTIVDAFAQWQPRPGSAGIFGRDMFVRLGVNNLFNASYLNARDVETTSRVGKGRNLYVQLETKF